MYGKKYWTKRILSYPSHIVNPFLSPIIYIYIEPLYPYDMPITRNQTRVATNLHWVRGFPSLPRYQRVWFSLVKFLKLQIYIHKYTESPMIFAMICPYYIYIYIQIQYMHIIYIYTLYIHSKKYIPSSSHESFLYTINIPFFTICVSPMNHNFCHLNLT